MVRHPTGYGPGPSTAVPAATVAVVQLGDPTQASGTDGASQLGEARVPVAMTEILAADDHEDDW